MKKEKGRDKESDEKGTREKDWREEGTKKRKEN